MPTIEFFGYSYEESLNFIEQIRSLLADLPFCQNIVFVLKPHEKSKVIGWDGYEYPFIRVFSRSQERSDLLRKILNTFADVETVHIGFYPKRNADKSSKGVIEENE